MRSLTPTLVLALLLGTAAGCDGQTPEPAPDTGGDVSFLLDGEEWAVGASVELVYREGRGYGLFTGWPTPGNPALRQSLIFSLPNDLAERPYPLATYVFEGNGYFAFMSERADDDSPLGTYASIGAGDALVVTRYDPATGELEATFEGTFAAAPRQGSPRTLPDTFRVTRGVVRATLSNPPAAP